MRVVAAVLLVVLAGCANAPPLEGVDPATVDEVLEAIDEDAGVGFCGCYWYSTKLSALSAENQATGASADAMPEGYQVDPSGTVTVDIVSCQHGWVAGQMVEEPSFALSRTGAIPPDGGVGGDTVALGAVVNSPELAVAFEAVGIPVAAIGTVDAFDEGITGSMRADATSDGLSFTAVHRTLPTREEDGLLGRSDSVPTHFADDGELRSVWHLEYEWNQFYDRDGGTVSFGGDTTRFVPGDPRSLPADWGFIVFHTDGMDIALREIGVERTAIECP